MRSEVRTRKNRVLNLSDFRVYPHPKNSRPKPESKPENPKNPKSKPESKPLKSWNTFSLSLLWKFLFRVILSYEKRFCWNARDSAVFALWLMSFQALIKKWIRNFRVKFPIFWENLWWNRGIPFKRGKTMRVKYTFAYIWSRNPYIVCN